MKRILILGSEGQIGQALTEHLRTRGYEVECFDILNTPMQDLRFIDHDFFDEVLQDMDFVFFLAFDVGGSHYLAASQDTFEFIENNLLIMMNTFKALRRNGKPFIFASSTLADVSKSTYGLLKAIGEKYTSACDGVYVKFWNVYGKENDPKKFHVISDFIKMSHENGRIEMRTDGSEERDFLHAEDCSRGLEAIMQNFNVMPKNSAVDLASFKWSSISEIAYIVSEKLNADIVPGAALDTVHQGIKTQPDPFILEYWQPTITLREGISKVIEETTN